MAKFNPDRLRILVVEDDPAYRELARQTLDGHQWHIVGTAKRGLEIFHEQLPDVTFLDLGLPDENGISVLLDIRSAHPEAFIVVLTASNFAEDVALAQRCLANGYIVKPFSRGQMKAQCEAYVKHREIIDAMTATQAFEFRKKIHEQTQKMQLFLQESKDSTQ